LLERFSKNENTFSLSKEVKYENSNVIGTVVRDNGASENDPADQISYSVFELDEPFALCTEKPDYPLFDVPQGQVKVE